MSAKPLPDHVAAGDEWKAWPRKAEAHVLWGARERQITAKCRSGSLQVWACPDDSLRLDPDKLTELYGPPGAVQGRDRDKPAAELVRARAEFDLSDPLASLLREVVAMLRVAQQEKGELLKLIVDPMNTIMAEFRDARAADRTRIKELEAGWLEVMDLRTELADAKQERDLQLKGAEAREKRRDDTLALIKPILPNLLMSLTGGGGDLKSFVAQCPPELVKGVIESGMLPPNLLSQLQKAAAQHNHTTNGAS